MWYHLSERKSVSIPSYEGFLARPLHRTGRRTGISENKAGSKIKLVTFDSDQKLVKFLKNGTIAALVVQDPFRMGYEGVKTGLTGVTLITKDNMEDPRSQELLNPKLK